MKILLSLFMFTILSNGSPIQDLKNTIDKTKPELFVALHQIRHNKMQTLDMEIPIDSAINRIQTGLHAMVKRSEDTDNIKELQSLLKGYQLGMDILKAEVIGLKEVRLLSFLMIIGIG